MANKFSVMELKSFLKQLNLSTTGNKAELFKRLEDAYPNQAWTEQFEQNDVMYSENINPFEEIDTFDNESPIANDETILREQVSVPNHLLIKEMELMRKEKEILERELSLAKRENEILRNSPQTDISIQTFRSGINIETIGKLLNDFYGGNQYFLEWEQQFKLLVKTYDLDEKMARILLGSKLKDKALQWFHSKKEHLEMKVEELLDHMKNLFDHREGRLELKRQLEKRKWLPNENFSDYYFDKITLANKVPIAEEEMIDYLIDGISDINLQNQARINDFKSAPALLNAFKKISLRSKADNMVKNAAFTTSKVPVQSFMKKTDIGSPAMNKCFNCNKQGHHFKDCFLLKKEKGSCFICGETDHFAKNCSKQEKNQIAYTDVTQPMEDEFHRIVDYGIENNGSIDNLRLFTLIDTGSAVSFIKQKFIKEKIDKLNELEYKFVGINNSPLNLVGAIKSSICLNGVIKKNITLLVVSDQTMLSPVVLGRDVLKKFNIGLTKPKDDEYVIPEIMNIDVVSLVEKNDFSKDILEINSEIDYEWHEKLKKIFISEYVNPLRPENPHTKAELTLVTRDLKPFHFTPRRLSFYEKGKLREILDKLKEKGIIRDSESEYASPIVLVKKKNGETRMCVDFRVLNKSLIRDNYPLPLIEDQLDMLEGKKYFSSLDLKDGFHHITMANDSIKFTSFVTPLGQFEYLKMPFGLKTAPSRFQRFVNEALSKLIKTGDVVVYMDDILIATQTISHHLEVLKQVFNLLVLNKMELRMDKCKFLYTNIDYLGYCISENGISPNKNGIEAVVNFPFPRNIREVQSFIGLCSYFRKFIYQFSVVAKPLYDLLKKNATFKFGKEELETFELLKEKLVSAPILSIYNPKRETELYCDASSIGFGAILMQKQDDNKFHPIFYFSKRTTDCESKYHSFELETLAIVYALKRFRIYLHGIKFKIITDCNSLRLTLEKKEVNPRISRWALELQNYDYELEHRPGKQMSHVDALSRVVGGVMVVEGNSFELNLSLSQNQDPEISKLKKILESKEDRHYDMRNGILYRKHENDLLFYVPQSMEMNIIFRYHDEMGHPGIEKTIATISQHYWFPKLKEKVSVHIKNCLKCIVYTPTSGKTERTLYNIPKGNVPFSTIHIDHLGPLSKERFPKRYVFLIIDSFTKYVKLYCTKTTSTKEVISCLKLYFSYYSKPNIIISDRGSSFTSKEFEDFIKDFDIKHIKIATASPHANGQAERVNRVLGPLIAKIIDNSFETSWIKVLEKAEYTINNTIHKITGETPCKLLFGINQNGKVEDKLKLFLDSFKERNEHTLEHIRDKAFKKINLSQNYNKNYCNRKYKIPHKYSKDDYVMVRNFENTSGTSQKLIPKFRGPYKITKELCNNRYIVADIDGFQMTQKPYQGIWEPANMRPWITNKNVNVNF